MAMKMNILPRINLYISSNTNPYRTQKSTGLAKNNQQTYMEWGKKTKVRFTNLQDSKEKVGLAFLRLHDIKNCLTEQNR